MVQEKVADQQHLPARKARESLRRLNWLTEAQAALGWGVILILAALLGVIYLSQASRIATVGRRVQILQNTLDTLHRENATLERKIAEAQSLERLQAEAARMGFLPADPEAIEYIIVTDYPPDTFAIPEPESAPVPPPVESMGEALWFTARGSITGFMRGESGE
ncbi:MAG: hypothetical protein H6662_12120 [Ardenticatenaceae bacterium]|nr:hypothetical protein [Anaerolineales bacterium]MCB8922321.1 hypothetical protein [Ardenticatenaceae bacterium]MCB8990495.1 hypothetical protein [Ardenticatenaceae bacterium]